MLFNNLYSKVLNILLNRYQYHYEEGGFIMQKSNGASALKEQLTIRGIMIGMIGSVIITTSSMYVALRMGALPGQSLWRFYR